ncbi:hypothetical protein [uncultured Thiodictyon sp.]|uniref:nSTAND1 domain-containing NTPase n=2 Tax=uncultured Thiodictyon sp. TaxID=1846217 RepID=UPI0025E5ECF8|nr:hypothetical protein [uncultured Thiodictyon sp.]
MNGRRPYPGLRPCNRDEDTLFFGRERQVDQLLDKLGDTHFIAVLGTSGSGKSSLVRAGMLPALEGGLLARAGARWEIAELRPGDCPLQRLAAALVEQTAWGAGPLVRTADPTPGSAEPSDPRRVRCADPAPADTDDPRCVPLESDLRKGPMALNWLLGLRPLDQGARLLILVDQFEELFRFADQGDEQTRDAAAREAGAFVALLLAAAQHPAVYVVITMRSDFLGDCARHPGLPEAVNAGLYLVPRLAPEQLADAIRLPARLCGGEVEADLVGRLLDDSRGEQDQLPLLQHALMRLWDLGAGDHRLTLTGYKRLGGLAEALNAHAQAAYAELAEAERPVAETLFRSLSGRGENGRDTRRPVRVSEVADLAGVDAGRVIAVAESFRAAGRSFLMPPPPGSEGGAALDADAMLDIAHESLIRQWRRLQQWAETEADQAAIYRRLESDARRRRDRGEATPWTGAELGLARPWLADLEHTRRWALRYAAEGEASVDLALAFLTESAAEEDRQREAKETLERERTAELFDSILTHSALLARTEDYAGARERLDSSRRLDGQIPATRRLARDLLARYAAIMGGSADKVYIGAGAKLFSVVISPDGRWVATSGERGTVVLFDAESGKLVQRLTGHDPKAGRLGSVYSLVFQPHCDWLASAGKDRQIILWTLPSADRPAAELRKWQAPEVVDTLAISPDGALLASGGDDKAITFWDPKTGKVLRTLNGHSAQISEIAGLAFSLDGTRLASASYDDTARIWDTRTGAETTRLTGHQGDVDGIAFSADGTRVATSGVDGRVILWDVQNGTQLRVFTGHANMVFGIDFTERTGEPGAAPLIAAAGFDRTIRVWDSESTVTQRLLQGHEAGVTGIAIKGGSLYSAANDGTVRRWPLSLPHQRLLDLPSEPASATIAPDGRSVAVGFADGSLRIWGLPDLQSIAELPTAHQTIIQRLAYSPDGTLLASAGFDKLARLWRIGPDGNPSPAFDLAGHEDAVSAVVFSPDGRRLATAGYDGRIGLFDTGSGKGRFIRSTKGKTMSVAFDPKGTRVIAGDRDDGKVRIWSITEDLPILAREYQAAADRLMWAETSADGSRIAAVGRDYVLNVLDTTTGKTLARLPGHEQTVFKARFLPGGHQVATVSTDATVRLWDLDTQTALFTLRLPTDRSPPLPLWDFDLRCSAPEPKGAGTCWLVVPLVRGKLAVYDLGPLPAGLAP